MSRWSVTHGGLHAQGHDSVFPPHSSYLILGFAPDYSQPRLPLPVLQVFVCLLIAVQGAPPLSQSGRVARIQTMRKNFSTSLNLWRTWANAGKHTPVSHRMAQYIKVPFITAWSWFLGDNVAF